MGSSVYQGEAGGWPPGTLAAAASFALATAASLYLLIAPTVTSVTASVGSGGRTVTEATLLQEEPSVIVVIVAVTLALTVLPLALTRSRLRTSARWTAAALLIAGSLVAGFSVGLFYMPSGLLMAVAAALDS